MTFWPTCLRPRSRPYTSRGIKRLQCVRCGAQAVHQWIICAEGNYRPMCRPCDVELNRLVLAWAKHPEAQRLGDEYEALQRRLAAEADEAWGAP